MKQINEYKSDYLGAILLFLVSPLCSVIYSLKNYEYKSSKYSLWFFVSYLGYSLYITDSYTGDAVRYRARFYELIGSDTSISSLFSVLLSDSQNLEIVERVISITVGRLTDNYHFLFCAYGLVFGYFFASNFAYLYKHIKPEKLPNTVFITATLFFVIPPWYINGFDFWCASQIFIYGILPYLIDNNRKYLIFILISPFVHFSFYIILVLSLFFLLIRNNDKFIFYLFCISFLFVYALTPSFFGSFIDYLPESIVRRSDAYINPEQIEHEGGRIVGSVRWLFSMSLNFVFAFLFLKNKKSILDDRNLKTMFLYTFYIIACFNILSIIPSVNRFLSIGRWLLLATLFMCLYSQNIKQEILQKSFYWIQPLVIVHCILEVIRTLFPLVGVGSILSNVFLIHSFEQNDFTIGNILKFLN